MPGRHPAEAESLAMHYGSCLLSLKLRFVSQAGDLVFNAAHARILLRSRRAPCEGLRRCAQSMMNRPLARSGGEPGTFRRRVFRPKPPGWDPPHWLTVATAGLQPTVFPRTVQNPDSTGVTRLAAGFAGPHHFRSRVTDRRRSPPDSRDRIDGGKRFPPGEPVTSALDLRSERSKVIQGAGNASSSRPFPGLSSGSIPGQV